jgi:hypothetical protein
MATSPQSFSTSNAYATLVSQWDAGIRSLDMSDIEQFTRFHTDEVAAIRRWNDFPVGKLQPWGGGTSAIKENVVGSTGQTVTHEAGDYGSKVVIKNRDFTLNPSLVDEKIAELRRAVQKRMKDLVYGALNGGFSDTYPTGASYGNRPYFTDQNPYATDVSTGAVGGTGAAGQPIQSNKLTTALDYAALNSAISLLQNFKDASGEPYGLGMGQLCLIVPTQLRAAAQNLAGGNLLGTSGTDANPNAGMISVVSSPYLSGLDVNNWFVCETAAGGSTPVNLWVSGMPSIAVTDDPANASKVITAVGYLKAWLDGPAAGIVGSQVA